MRRAALRHWLLSSHLVVLLLPLLALVGTGALGRDLLVQARINLLDQGALIGLLVSRELSRAEEPLAEVPLDELIGQASDAAHAAIRVVDASGVVVATSGPRRGDDLSQQPEVVAALEGQQAWQVRQAPPPSPGRPGPVPSELERTRLYVTNPILLDEQVVGAVLLSRTPRQSLEALLNMGVRLRGGLLAALALTFGMALLSSHALSRSLRALSQVANRIADGELSAAEDLAPLRRSRLMEVGDLADAFSNMTDRLRARLGYVREFASNVSHEFKTPLSTLQGTIELLRDDTEMPPAQRTRFLDNALAELHRMTRLVSGLLELAQAEEVVAGQRISLMELLAALQGRYPALVVTGEAGVVQGDQRQLEAVLINLIENALQHGSPPVTAQGWQAEGRTGVRIIDAGPGISPANQRHVFDRFFTTDREEGTGLGLALAAAICTAHGGSIDVQSAPGRTAFTITLPAV